MPVNILIAEDEENIRELLNLHLSKEGYNIFMAGDGEMALEIFEREPIDLLLLDVMMPKMDGFNVLKKIREKSKVPVIFLTARDEEQDKILGLGLGADDYVIKPFSIIEITSRIQAQLRRYLEYSSKEVSNIITNGDLTLNLDTYELTKSGTVIDLNPKEFKIISLFMKNPGMVYTKKQLYEKVWEELYWGDDNTIMVHISHIREKIEDNPKKPKYLKTIRGIGYRMEKIQ